jgi:MFS family permease
MAVGLPGLLLALWVFTLKEPMRGQSEGLRAPPNPAPFRGFFAELLTIIPPFTLVGAAEIGLKIGAPAMLAGFLGVTLGGLSADRLRARYATGRIMVVLFGGLAPIAPLVIAFTTPDQTVFFIALPLAQLLTSSALGAAAAASQDLVLPRMRGAATGAFFIGTTLLGLALGPYLAGRVADLTHSLSTGLLSLLVVVPIALIAGIAAFRMVPAAEASREERARAAGEPM